MTRHLISAPLFVCALLVCGCSNDDSAGVSANDRSQKVDTSEREAYERRSLEYFTKLESGKSLDFSSDRFLAYYLTTTDFDDMAALALERAVEVEPERLRFALAMIEAKAILSEEPETTLLLLTQSSLLGLGRLEPELVDEMAVHEGRIANSGTIDQKSKDFVEKCLAAPLFSNRLASIGILLFASKETSKSWAATLVREVSIGKSVEEQYFWYVVAECMAREFSDEAVPDVFGDGSALTAERD